MLYSVSINGENMLDRGLILLADIVVPKPKARRNTIIVPGADGDVDDTIALTGEPVFDSIDISFTLFKGVGDVELDKIRTKLCNDFQGREVRLTLPHDTTHYYKGILTVGQLSDYGSGKIPMRLHANPWRWKNSVTKRVVTTTTTAKVIVLQNERKSVVPTITVDRETTVTFGDGSKTIQSGSHRMPSIQLKAGISELKAKTTSGTGKITIEYQEGSL